MRRTLSLLLAAAFLLSFPVSCGKPAPEISSAEESAPQPVNTIYPQWNASTIYLAGDIVVHNGKYFKALWWTRGNEPKEDVERDEWHYLGTVPTKHNRYFNDIPTDAWYADAVNTLAERGIVTGTGSGFLPSRPATHAQFAVMLCRALEIAPAEDGENFADAGNSWYSPYFLALKQQGLLQGDEENCIYPTHYITRQEMCLLIYNACNGFAEDPVTVFAPYTDADTVASWAIQPLSWCIERGIIQGDDDKLLPEAAATRAEAAQTIYNLLQWLH